MASATPLATAALLAVLLAGCASKPPEKPATPAATATTSPPPITSTRQPSPDSPPAAEVPASGQFANFSAWKADFADRARIAGISESTVQGFLATARFLPRVVELDRAQPEFTRTAWQYLDGAVSPQRIAQGRRKMQEYAAALGNASQRYGVPAAVVTAIWGMESNYGGNFGNISTINALATLAYDGRRAQWAGQELLAALRIIDNGDIDASRMLGSWAGAMGHTQFLPSVFLRYAIDADGDGHRDIWGSIADVTASTANYLSQSGWNLDEPWGVEVRLPPGFDYARAELSERAGSGQWAAEGVQAANGRPLPTLAGASIITPVGAHGPTFLVGTNFRAILRYNNSINYALAVALLADQLAGNAGVRTPWPRDLQPLTREQMRGLQTALSQRGFDAGAADGVMGPATRAGLRRYQQSLGLQADGYPTLQLLRQLQGN